MATLIIKGFPDPVYRRIKRLAAQEHRSVAQQVVHMLSKAVAGPRMESILALRGLGKSVWASVDAAAHVAGERGSWR